MLLVALVLIALGCDKRLLDREVRFDLQGFDALIEARLDRMYTNAGLDKNMDAFAEAVIADPGLAAGGEKLFAALSSDPELAAQVEKVMGSLAESPRVQALVMALMASNPGKDVGALAGEKVGKAWDTPAISKGFENAFGELINKLDVKGELRTVSQAVERRTSGIFNDTKRTSLWSARLIQLNGGVAPDPKRATQLYLDNAWSDARTQKFFTTILANPTLRAETAKFFAELLALDAITTELKSSASALASDPEIQAVAGQLMIELLEGSPKISEITGLQRKLVLSPVTVKLSQRLAHVVLTDPKVAQLAGTHIDKISADPVLRAAFDELIDHW
jgi:hypothetical protein